jgi:uncharacterized protein (DUF983 family)
MGLFGKKKPELVDLTDHIDLTEPTPSPVVFGLPMKCPECGDHGYLDHIDPYKRIMYQHCPSCFAKWEVAEADLTTSA